MYMKSFNVKSYLSIGLILLLTPISFAMEAIDKQDISYLFVLQAEHARVDPIEDKSGYHKISMKLKERNIKKVIEFSDRPYRIIKHMTVFQLEDMWGKGINSFQDNAPNAVLSAQDVAVQILVIESLRINDKMLELVVYNTDGELAEARFEDLVIVIDGIWDCFLHFC